jgi:hypothetical protein
MENAGRNRGVACTFCRILLILIGSVTSRAAFHWKPATQFAVVENDPGRFDPVLRKYTEWRVSRLKKVCTPPCSSANPK